MLVKRSTIGAVCAVVLLLVLTGTTAAAAVAPDVRVAAAAMNGDLQTVRSLVTQKVDVNIPQGDGMTALHWAAFKDDLEMAKLLLRAAANVKATTRIGDMTPLFLACTNGNAAMIDLLVKAGADPNSENTVHGQTALMMAASAGNPDAVKVLLDHGAEINAKEKTYQQTALMFAASNDRAAAIKMLVAKGADAKATTIVEDLTNKPRFDDDGNLIPPTPKDPKTGAPANGVGNRSAATVTGGMTALLLAARDGKMEAVKALVEAGVDVNQRSPAESSTPLIISIANGFLDVGKYLLDHGANPNAFNKDGLTPLYATIDIEYAPLSWAPAPLTTAEKITYLQLMEDLLKAGANPNARLTRKLFYRPSSHDRSWVRPEGTTAFWRAALSNDVPSMKLLIEYGADPTIASDEGVTPLLAAAGIGWVPGNFTQTWREDDARLQAVQYCIDLGLDVNARDKKDQTALHGAAWSGDHKVIQLLVDKKAKLDVLSKSGWYVTDMPNGVDVAGGLPTERPETVNFLLKLGAPAPVAPKAGSGIVKKRP